MSTMVQPPLSTDLTDLESSSYSSQAQTLATNLRRHLGMTEAIKVCEKNEWHSVLAALRHTQTKKQ